MIILNILPNPNIKNCQKVKYTISTKKPIIHIRPAKPVIIIKFYAFLV